MSLQMASEVAVDHLPVPECAPRAVSVTMTMTMTHSSEVTNKCKKPGPTDISAGAMTPCKKNLFNLYALLRKQGREALGKV